MIKQKLQADQIQALKTADRERLEVIRFILAKIVNAEIAKQEDLTDTEVVAVIRKHAKELEESITAFEKGNRADLVAHSQGQLTIVRQYLPAEMSDEKLREAIEKIIADNHELYQQNPKKIIGLCMSALKSQAAPARIMAILQSINK